MKGEVWEYTKAIQGSHASYLCVRNDVSCAGRNKGHNPFPLNQNLPQQIAQDGSSCIIKNPLHTRVITFFKDKNYNYFLTSRFNAEYIFTAIDEKTFLEIQVQLMTKILQVRHCQRKFLSKVRVTLTERNPAQGPMIIQRGKFRYKGPSSTAL